MTRVVIHIALLAAASVPLSCDNTIDPFVDGGEEAFVVFGYLDMGADTQFVRIAPIRPGSTPASGPVPEAVVARELESGVRVPWTDSLVTIDDGTQAHLYHSVFAPEAGGTYVVEVHAGGGAPLRAFTRVPPEPETEVASPRVIDGQVFQVLTWDPVDAPADVRVRYQLQVGRAGEPADVEIDYDRRAFSTTGDRLTVSADLSGDFRYVQSEIEDRFGVESGSESIALIGVEMTVRALSPEWEDAEPGTNIENGEGFFASVGEFTAAWSIADSVARRIGYVTPEP